jgi:hypothetical protein
MANRRASALRKALIARTVTTFRKDAVNRKLRVFFHPAELLTIVNAYRRHGE